MRKPSLLLWLVGIPQIVLGAMLILPIFGSLSYSYGFDGGASDPSVLMMAHMAIGLFAIAHYTKLKDTDEVPNNVLVGLMIGVCVVIFLYLGIGLNTSDREFGFLFLVNMVSGVYLLLATRSLNAENEPDERGNGALDPPRRSYAYNVFIIAISLIFPLILAFAPLEQFSSIWFLIIGCINAAVIIIPASENRKNLSLILIYLKTIGLVYSLYFTLIVLPYILPALAIIYKILPLFILIPPIIFFEGLVRLRAAKKTLMSKHTFQVIAAVALGIATLPVTISANFYFDRINFQNALVYVEADADKTPNVNGRRLERTLNELSYGGGYGPVNTLEVDSIAYRRRDTLPFIKPFYRLIVLDDKTVSSLTAEKTQKLRQIFGYSRGYTSGTAIPELRDAASGVVLSNISTQTEFDEKSGVYKTWVNLEMMNKTRNNLAEYQTQFTLPDGCFIKDYYLYVGDENKRGILAERKAAVDVYRQITRTTRDPGIVYYKDNDTIELRVYPFAPSEVRKTGFMVIHSQNEVLNIGGQEVVLAAENPIESPIELQGVTFVSAAYKGNLPPSSRTAKYYFLIDAGEGSPIERHVEKVEDFIAKQRITNYKTYAVSHKTTEITDSSSRLKTEFGFNFGLAAEKILKNSPKGEYPIIIAVTDNMARAVAFDKGYMAGQFPESQHYYNLGYDLLLTTYSFANNRSGNLVDEPIIGDALEYNGVAVANDGKSQAVRTGEVGGYIDNEYYNAFLLQQKSRYETGADIARESLRYRTLTRHTAFTVLETQEQEAMLYEQQDRNLNPESESAGSWSLSDNFNSPMKTNNLDIAGESSMLEDQFDMTEPNYGAGLIVLVVIAAIFVYFRRRPKKK